MWCVSWLEAVSCWAGWVVSSLSLAVCLIMSDRLIRGESYCVSITTDRVNMFPLNLYPPAGREEWKMVWGEGPASRETKRYAGRQRA